MNTAVLYGLGGYLLVMLAIGLWASRRISGSTDFIVAGKRLSLLLCSATLAATWFGGGLCIGAASAAYGGGFLAVIADPFGAALCLFLAGLFYVRIMRRMGLMTIASFFSSRFDSRAGVVASLCTIPAYIGWVGALLVAFGRILQSLSGMDPTTTICIGAAIVLIYTFAGGMWAVTLTDFIQLIILIVGMVVLTPILLADMGGWEYLSSQIPEERFDIFPAAGAGGGAWLNYGRDWLVIGLGNLAGQDLIQRSLSSRDEKVAYRSAYVAGFIYVTIGFLPVLLGMAGAVVLPDLANPDLVMMELAEKYLPTAALILFTGALVSALLSSADSALLAPASVIGWDLARALPGLWDSALRRCESQISSIARAFGADLHGRFLERFALPSPSERTSLRISRLSVITCGLIALAIALNRSSVYDLMVDTWSVLLATLFVPLTAGIWWKRSNTPGALAAIVAGLCTWLALTAYVPSLPGDLLAVPVAAVVLILTSLATARTHVPKPLSDENGQPLKYAGRLGWTVSGR